MNGQTLEAWDRKPWRESRYRDRLLLQTPVDLWLFSELLDHLKPRAIFELGVLQGGFSCWLGDQASVRNLRATIFGVDVDELPEPFTNPTFWAYMSGVSGTEFRGIQSDSIQAMGWIEKARNHPVFANHPALFILADDPKPGHVQGELDYVGEIAKPGDWIVVCDTVPDEGLGPAVERWLSTTGRVLDVFPVRWDRFGLTNHRWLRKGAAR